MVARRYRVRGRVQGVGFRAFVHRSAKELGLLGWVRNTDDGGVEVIAAGPEEAIASLAGLIHKGPRGADVRGVDEHEAPVQQYGSFEIR